MREQSEWIYWIFKPESLFDLEGVYDFCVVAISEIAVSLDTARVLALPPNLLWRARMYLSDAETTYNTFRWAAFVDKHSIDCPSWSLLSELIFFLS